MARLNFIRPHRRTQSSQSTSSHPPETTPSSAPPPTAPAHQSSASLQLTSLPPLDVGSPGLGSPGQWLTTPPAGSPNTPSTATSATPGFSRLSSSFTPTTELTPTAVPHVPRPSSNHRPAASSPATVALSPHTAAATTSPPAPKPEKHKESRKEKLNRLNPITLLRRRSSQSHLALEKEKNRRSKGDLPDDFDPGIIYGTRHPDWSSGAKKREGVQGLSPVPVGLSPPTTSGGEGGRGIAGRMGMGARGEDGRKSTERWRSGGLVIHQAAPPSPPSVTPPVKDEGRLHVQHETLEVTITAPTEERPGSALSFEPVQFEENSPTPTTEIEDDGAPYPGMKRVTLVDHPLALPHHAKMNGSRFSFEGSNTPSIAETSPKVESLQESSCETDDEFQLDMDDDGFGEDDGFAKANEGYFDDDGGESLNQPPEDYSELAAAVNAMNLNAHRQQTGLGMSLSNAQVLNGPSIAGQQNPQQSGYINPEDDEWDSPEAQVPTRAKSKIHQLANPRGLELSDDSDLDDPGLNNYEDDDDSFYFEDGVITSYVPVDPPQESPPPPANPPPTEATDPEPPNDPSLNRLSLLTHGVSSGLDPQDGSMSPPPNDSSPPLPPFLNPVGGGLGYTPAQPQFYNPNVSSNILNGYALSRLLHDYQVQQAAALAAPLRPTSPADEPDNPNNMPPFNPAAPHFDDLAGYEDELADYDALDGYEEDPSIIAAANAEALASDAEGFYGSEFGFYPSSANNELGGFFGAAGGAELLRPPIRRPSLTPISERSESSYRNSMVFPVAAWNAPMSPAMDDVGAAEMSYNSLRALRRSAFGGSSGSLRSGAASPRHSWLREAENANDDQDAAGGGQKDALETLTGATAGVAAPPGLAAVPMGSSPSALGTTPPPGLRHAGSRAMLPTQKSFEEAAVGGAAGF